MSVLAWLFLGLVAVAVAALSFWLGRHNAPTTKRVRELEEQLAENRAEMGNYRREVNRHFEQTAELVGDVNTAYRNLYCHLAEDSQRLAPGPAERLLESMGEQPVLERRTDEESAAGTPLRTGAAKEAGPDRAPEREETTATDEATAQGLPETRPAEAEPEEPEATAEMETEPPQEEEPPQAPKESGAASEEEGAAERKKAAEPEAEAETVTETEAQEEARRREEAEETSTDASHDEHHRR